MNRLTEKAEREMEEAWTLRNECVELLRKVNDEWKSDPKSVQCFDLRIVRRTHELLNRLEKIHVAWM